MYKKAVSGMTLFYLVLFVGFWCVTALKIGAGILEGSYEEEFLRGYEERPEEYEPGPSLKEALRNGNDAYMEASMEASMEVPVLDKQISVSVEAQNPHVIEADEEDVEALCRIVEAEAGSEDEEGRILVANVVINRVNDKNFPDTIKEVVLQQKNGVAQFSPVGSGRYYRVEISEATYTAVEKALAGEDISQGALFFVSRKRADSDSIRWFDENLKFLFEHGGHEFFCFQ